MMKKTLICLLLPFIIFCQGSTFTINATQNAAKHNNTGIDYLNDGYYIQAIQEFKLAIMLNPHSTVTASFYNNLGNAYIKINRYDWAQTSFEQSISINPNFYDYYKKLIFTYKKQNIMLDMLSKYKSILDSDITASSAWLMSGLIYYELGDFKASLDCLERYTFLEPDLILTEAIKKKNEELKKELNIISL